jgi:hypothetical protein
MNIQVENTRFNRSPELILLMNKMSLIPIGSWVSCVDLNKDLEFEVDAKIIYRASEKLRKEQKGSYKRIKEFGDEGQYGVYRLKDDEIVNWTVPAYFTKIRMAKNRIAQSLENISDYSSLSAEDQHKHNLQATNLAAMQIITSNSTQKTLSNKIKTIGAVLPDKSILETFGNKIK